MQWRIDLLELLRERKPAARSRHGVHTARPLSQAEATKIDQHVRDFGGWERFNAAIVPKIREASSIGNPAGFVGRLCKQASNGASPAEGHQWVPPDYRRKSMSPSVLVAALEAVAWGGNYDTATRQGAMAWALQNIDRADVRRALHNNFGPTPRASTEVLEALQRFK